MRPTRLRRTLSFRERIERNNATDRFYAMAAGVDPKFQTQLPPKRERIRRPVDGKPLGPTEHQEQCAVIQWWALVCPRYELPPWSLFAIPNGGARDAITGARLKDEGVRPGVLDLMLAKPTAHFAGLFIEMKVGDNKPSEKQQEFVNYLNAAGYKAEVHWSSDSAIRAIESYLGVPPL